MTDEHRLILGALAKEDRKKLQTLTRLYHSAIAARDGKYEPVKELVIKKSAGDQPSFTAIEAATGTFVCLTHAGEMSTGQFFSLENTSGTVSSNNTRFFS